MESKKKISFLHSSDDYDIFRDFLRTLMKMKVNFRYGPVSISNQNGRSEFYWEPCNDIQ